jgi:hypothetical protein
MTTVPRGNSPDNAAGGTPANESDVDEVYEQDIPVDIQLADIICLTPESAVGGLEVDSFAGSGPVIYPDFRTAIRDAWGEFESHSGLYGMPLTDETDSPELRTGRHAFKALLARFDRDGYSPDMAQELLICATSTLRTASSMSGTCCPMASKTCWIAPTDGSTMTRKTRKPRKRARAPHRATSSTSITLHISIGWRINSTTGDSCSKTIRIISNHPSWASNVSRSRQRDPWKTPFHLLLNGLACQTNPHAVW